MLESWWAPAGLRVRRRSLGEGASSTGPRCPVGSTARLREWARGILSVDGCSRNTQQPASAWAASTVGYGKVPQRPGNKAPSRRVVVGSHAAPPRRCGDEPQPHRRMADPRLRLDPAWGKPEAAGQMEKGHRRIPGRRDGVPKVGQGFLLRRCSHPRKTRPSRGWPPRPQRMHREDKRAHLGQQRGRQRRRRRRTGGAHAQRCRGHPSARRQLRQRYDRSTAGARCVSSYSRDSGWDGRSRVHHPTLRRGRTRQGCRHAEHRRGPTPHRCGSRRWCWRGRGPPICGHA